MLVCSLCSAATGLTTHTTGGFLTFASIRLLLKSMLSDSGGAVACFTAGLWRDFLNTGPSNAGVHTPSTASQRLLG
jgi:hypothetical protein